MALSYEMWRDIILYIREHPEAEEELRALVLSKEMLAVPARLMELIEAIGRLEKSDERLRESDERLRESDERLRESVRELRESIEEQRKSIDEQRKSVEGLVTSQGHLIVRFNRLEGRWGNVEGGLLEARYDRHLRDWLRAVLRRPTRVAVSDLQLLEAGRATGVVSEAEYEDVFRLDLVATGQDPAGPGERLVAAELSVTINVEDVARAHRRAGVLRKAGYETVALVGGYEPTDDAIALARDLDVHINVHRPPD